MWLLLALLAGCPRTSSDPSPATEVTVPASPFEAVLSVDAEPGGKHFQGVWLQPDGGERLLVAYRALGCFTPFDGKRVTVTGEAWTPDPTTQHVLARHYRVDTLTVPADAGTDYVSVGPERKLRGTVRTTTGEPGTKSEGESWREFVSGDQAYGIANPGELPNGDATLTVRVMEPSPFVGGRSDPVVYVVD